MMFFYYETTLNNGEIVKGIVIGKSFSAAAKTLMNYYSGFNRADMVCISEKSKRRYSI